MASGLVSSYPVLYLVPDWDPVMWGLVPPSQTVLLPELWHHTRPWINPCWLNPLPLPSALGLSYIPVLRTFLQGRPASAAASWPQQHSVAPSKFPLIPYPFITSCVWEVRGCLCNLHGLQSLKSSQSLEGKKASWFSIAKYHVIGSNFRILTHM